MNPTLATTATDAAQAVPSCHQVTPEGVMIMSGIPEWVFLSGIVAILVITFIGAEKLGAGAGDGFRINLTKNKKIYDIFRHRGFQYAAQLIGVLLLGGLLFAGIFGSQVRNITPIAVWTIWWGGLIFAILLVGPLFCFGCPWDGLANFVTRFGRMKRVEPLSLGLDPPKFLRNVYPAIFLFVVLTWLELGWGVTTSPSATAYMGLGMAAVAVGSALLFQDKAFCRWMCPVGRISGIYSNFSPVEIRRRNAKVCERCTTHDCLKGNEHGYACPGGILLKEAHDASYCTSCSECFKTCNKRNVALNLRPFATDLKNVVTVTTDQAWLALSLLTLTLFHGFSMTSAWENFAPGGSSMLKWMMVTFGVSRTVAFTAGMVVVCAVPIVLYWLSCRVAVAWVGDRSVTSGEVFRQFSFSLLPVALFYHLAHNTMHILHEGGAIIPMLSDPMGRGWDLFGTASWEVGSLVSDEVLWAGQVGLILIGHVAGIFVAHRIGYSMFTKRRAAMKSLIPMLVVMIAVSVIGLGLMHLDMNMRVGRM